MVYDYISLALSAMVHESLTDHLEDLQQRLYQLLHAFCDHDLAVKATLTVIARLLQDVSLVPYSLTRSTLPATIGVIFACKTL